MSISKSCKFNTVISCVEKVHVYCKLASCLLFLFLDRFARFLSSMLCDILKAMSLNIWTDRSGQTL